ncbi:MAG: indolepyruvate ferredoxin oxidoreductase subunit alpha [Rhodobacterales bacterium]|nr:indolepyruvate ferredoxin oxidoreductase subunit alpha [Rhodobacterales bacterium]
MERSFAGQVRSLVLGDGETFHGETILAVTKALLQSGVAYVGGYPGAPVSHLMDVLADASDEILKPLGIHFEQAASEAGAAAMLGASIHYPLRGAVTWKSIVGTNVASDALSNLASAGVVGGALIVVGEDYGEGASVIQERTHAMAMKSSLPLIDPRYDMARVVDLTEAAFDLSEACNLPVVMSLRIRACHMTGSFQTKANRAPAHGINNPLPGASFDYGRIVLPPSIYAQEKAKVERRLPAAQAFIRDRGLNELMGEDRNRPQGIILQGGTYSVVIRALRRLGLADALGRSQIPLLVLNVIHPLVPDQITGFLEGKESVLVVEEGNPAFIENQVRALAQQAGLRTAVHGKDRLPPAGEYVAATVRQGIAAYLAHALPGADGQAVDAANGAIEAAGARSRDSLAGVPVPPRPPGFCTGCPERPVFTALKLIMAERGPLHISSDIGCNTFATLPPFNIGNTVLGYGLSLASGGAVGPALGQPVIAIMGDGGFWHNGLTTGAINAQWQGHDTVLIILENGYASATGQQHVPSSGSTPQGRPSVVSIEAALKGIGVRWIRRVDSYSVEATRTVIEEALDARGQGLRVIISDNECMLAKKRRGKNHQAKARRQGKPIRKSRFGVDESVCTGDHSCMRLSGCPSLSLRPATDPLKDGPTATVESTCVACALCGEAAHAARLCPSFYKAKGLANPAFWDRVKARVAQSVLSWMGAS